MQVRFRYGLRLCSEELTTPGYPDAAPLRYKGVRTTPFTGLEPARLVAVTAYNPGCDPGFPVPDSRLTVHETPRSLCSQGNAHIRDDKVFSAIGHLPSCNSSISHQKRAGTPVVGDPALYFHRFM